MANPKRKIVREQLTDVSPYDLDGTLADMLDRVNQWIEDYGVNARLDWDAHFHHDYDSNPSPRFNIVRDREENDEEYNRRIAKEKLDKQIGEARELAELERLQKKFAGKK
jgi:hypothetical protein